jgi:hypothetical protein
VAIIMGQATVPAGTTGTFLFAVPASSCAVTFYNLTTVPVWIGTSTAVTSSIGMQCHSLPTSFTAFIGSKGQQLFGTTGGTAVSTIQYIISSDF